MNLMLCDENKELVLPKVIINWRTSTFYYSNYNSNESDEKLLYFYEEYFRGL